MASTLAAHHIHEAARQDAFGEIYREAPDESTAAHGNLHFLLAGMATLPSGAIAD